MMAPGYDFPVGTYEKDPSFQQIRRMIADFRGYDTIEDLKAADGQIRDKLAARLKKAIEASGEARKYLTELVYLKDLTDFDRMVGDIRQACEKLRSGSPQVAACQAYRPKKDAVREVYTLDFKMLSGAENIFNLMQEFRRMAREDMILGNIFKIDMSAREILDSIDKKSQVISCMIL